MCLPVRRLRQGLWLVAEERICGPREWERYLDGLTALREVDGKGISC